MTGSSSVPEPVAVQFMQPSTATGPGCRTAIPAEAKLSPVPFRVDAGQRYVQQRDVARVGRPQPANPNVLVSRFLVTTESVPRNFAIAECPQTRCRRACRSRFR